MLKKIIINMSSIMSFINSLIPKKNNRIVFYSNLGFRDNVRFLYDYMIKMNVTSKFEIVVATNDCLTCKKEKGIKYVSCLTGVFYFLTSRYFFYSFGKYPIKPSRNQMVINLWHGMPLKRIGNLEYGNENKKYNFFNYVVSTGESFNEIMKMSFKCTDEQILRIGQPRNDVMFNKVYKTKIFDNYKRILIWMPTFRVSAYLNTSNTSDANYVLPFFKNDDDLIVLNSLLKENNALLFIKLHPMQKTDIVKFADKSHIKFVNEEYFCEHNINLYEFLSYTDALITDYSSVYIDYLLLNKPILFTVDDMVDYESNRGFNFDNPFNYMPGPHINTKKEFMEEIMNVIDGNDLYKNDRVSINKCFNGYDQKGFNCKSILQFCKIIGDN